MAIDPESFTILPREMGGHDAQRARSRLAKCSKEIVDFRKMSADEIERTHATTSGICGLYTVTQFRRPPAGLALAAAASIAISVTPVAMPAELAAQGSATTPTLPKPARPSFLRRIVNTILRRKPE